MKNKLMVLKRELERNRKYNHSKLYVCKIKNKSDGSIKVGIYNIIMRNVKGYSLFEELPSRNIYSIKIRDDINYEVLEIIQFSSVYPEYFYPSLSVIEELNSDLNARILKKEI